MDIFGQNNKIQTGGKMFNKKEIEELKVSISFLRKELVKMKLQVECSHPESKVSIVTSENTEYHPPLISYYKICNACNKVLHKYMGYNDPVYKKDLIAEKLKKKEQLEREISSLQAEKYYVGE